MIVERSISRMYEEPLKSMQNNTPIASKILHTNRHFTEDKT